MFKIFITIFSILWIWMMFYWFDYSTQFFGVY